jgi:formylglycine-generating enzyme required for sulfatase activity
VKKPIDVKAASSPHTETGFVLVKGGTFTMGSPASEPERAPAVDDEVQHKVTVSPFYIGKYEVTQLEYEAVTGENPSHFKGDDLPVENISWYDAIAYCNKRSEQEELIPAYTITGGNVIWDKSANGYRLPTEAEWEYACRAGTTTPFSTGANITTDQANYDGNEPYNRNAKGESRKKTVSVGSFKSNPWGLYDMHGNVWEWCWDRWGSGYEYALSEIDPKGAGPASCHVRRGGSWSTNAGGLRSAYRGNITYHFENLGFRLARTSL